MIQSTPAAPSPACAMPGIAIPVAGKEGAEVKNFSTLLGAYAPAPEVQGEAGPTAALTEPANLPVPASPATSGKILPPGFPVAVAAVTGDEPLPVAEVLPSPKPRTAKPVIDHPLPATKRAKLTLGDVTPISEVLTPKSQVLDPVPVSDPIAVKPGEVLPVSDVIAVKPGEAVPVADVISVKPGEAVPVSDIVIAKPYEPIPVSDVITAKPKTDAPIDVAPKGQGPVQRTIPDLPEQASERAHAQVERREAQIPAAPTLPAALVAPPTKPGTPVMRRLPETKPADVAAAEPLQPAPPLRAVPAEEVRLSVALPRTATLLNIREEGRPVLPAEALQASVPQLSGEQTLSAAPVPQAIATSPVAQVRPHDFGALIDRLSAAREALAPQTVSVTVAHQEFGPVRLHFRPEDAGLSVAMSSADPDFARASAAAPTLVLPTAASEQSGAAQQHRSEGGSAQQGGFAQPRGQSSERREGQTEQQHRPAPQPHGSDRGNPQRSGIFA